MDAGRRYEISGSEMMNRLLQQYLVIARVHYIMCEFPRSKEVKQRMLDNNQWIAW